MKKAVIEQLQQMGLAEIFNETDFKEYRKKAGKGGNLCLATLNIVDMFVLNKGV